MLVLCICSVIDGLDNGLGLVPPLAWSSWNYFNGAVNESLIQEIGDAMVSTGLASIGFRQINIDSGYLLRERDAHGQMVPNASKFPSGMRALADYLASRPISLGLGLYTDITDHTCGPDKGGPGAWGHYKQDAATFAAWNISYLKVDMCSVDIGIDPESQLKHWGEFRDALNSTGHPIYYSICPHSVVPHPDGPGAWWWVKGDNGTRPNTYAPPTTWTAPQRRGLANSLLVEFTNLFDFWYSPHWLAPHNCPGHQCNTSSPGGFLTNVDAMAEMTKPEYSGPGSWADADMLHVCNYGEGGIHAGGSLGKGMTLTEYSASLSIWAVLASPIIISADVRTLSERHPECLNMLLGATEVLEISQDPLGSPGRLVHQATNGSTESVPTTTNIVEQIWARKLKGGRLAVVFFNRDENTRTLTFKWDMWDNNDGHIGLRGWRRARDAWSRQDLDEGNGACYNVNVTVNVTKHQARVIVLSPDSCL